MATIELEWSITERRKVIIEELKNQGFDLGQTMSLVEMFVVEMRLAYAAGCERNAERLDRIEQRLSALERSMVGGSSG